MVGRNHTPAMQPLRILVTGADGFLAGFLGRAVQRAGHRLLTTARNSGDAPADLLKPSMVAAIVEALQPDLVLHTAAMSRLADCEQRPDLATRTNAWLAEQWADRFGARCLYTSTDLVFDGGRAPYRASDPVAPLSAYGASKAEGEERVRAHGGRVVRLPLLFGPDAHGRGASASLRRALANGESPALFTNEYRSPLHAADAAAALVEALVAPDGPGLFHLAGPERVSRWELGQRFCCAQRLDRSRLRAVECHEPLRPRDTALVGDWPLARDLEAMLLDA
jgi:dTDP-4-dehydrorhamnose reductase